MKKASLVYIIVLAAAVCLSACSREAGQPRSESPAAILSEPKIQDSAPGARETAPKSSEAVPGEPESSADTSAETEGSEEVIAGPEESMETAVSSKEPGQDGQDTSDTDDQSGQNVSAQNSSALPDIIWIGDSLTQGSLGDDNHNKNNPQAPWRVLGEISGLNVAGAGFYGYTASDIFWAYGEYNGIKDPQVTYVYWVGSNDCHESPDNVKNVIEETDRFNANNGITDFLMLGTTDRSDMPAEYADSFNKALSDYYGDKYLDILPYVEYGPDGVHLTERSYAAIARAVYEKLNK